jgi:hypothetical protein
MARLCADCDQPALAPERLTTFVPVPMKQNGWVGDKFIPRERKFKAPLERNRTVCGICAANHYAYEHEADQRNGNGESSIMNSDEFYQHMADLATMENGARMDALDAEKRKADRARAGPRAKRSAAKPAKNNGAQLQRSARVKRTIPDLPCGCKPYVDIKIFTGWRAEGRRVFVDGRARRAWPKGPSCYCRCQTEPIPAKERVAA